MTAAKAVAILKDRPNAKLTITDTAENISKNFDFLSANKQKIQISPFLGSISKLQISYQQYLAISSDDSFLPSSYKVGITSATVQESLSLLSDKKITEINITDSSQDFIEAARLLGKAEQVNYFNKVKEIKFTDNQKNVKLQALDLSLKPLLDAKLKGSSVTVTGSIDEINKISNLKRLGAVEIVDTNQNISTRFNTIQSLKNNIVGISSSDPQAVLAISAEQAKSNKNLLQTIKSGFELKLTQASARDAASFAKDSRITSINVVDTVSNLTRNLSRINSENSKVASVTVSDQSKKISENLTAIFKIKNAELKIIQTDAKNPIEVSADALSMNRYLITKSFGENSIKLKDTAENISKHLNNLNSVKTQIKEISVSDNKSITANFSQIESLIGKFQAPTKIDLIGDVKNLGPKIGSVNLNYEKANIIRQTSSPINARKPRTIDPIELTVSQLSSINSPISIASSRNSAVVKDTAANVSANINTIINLNNQIQKITITDNQPIAATYAQLGQIMSKFGESQTFIVNDTAANVSANLSAITAMGNKVAQINLTDNAQITATYAEISPVISQLVTQNSVNLTDTAANVSANLSAITAMGNKVAQINLTDNAQITATYAEISPVISQLVTPNSVNLNDTAANVSANLSAITAMGNKVAQINLTDNAQITATYADISPVISRIAPQNSVIITDSAANISANLVSVSASINHIASINLTDTNLIPASTYSQFVSFDNLAMQSKLPANALISFAGTKEEIQKIAFDYFDNTTNITSRVSSMQVANQAASEIIVDTNFIESNNRPLEFFFRQPQVGFWPQGRWNIFMGNILFTKDSTNGDRIVAKFDSGRNDLFYHLSGLSQGEYRVSVDIKNETGTPFILKNYVWSSGTEFIVGANTDWTTYTHDFTMQTSEVGTVEMNFLSDWWNDDNPPGAEILISKISLTKIA